MKRTADTSDLERCLNAIYDAPVTPGGWSLALRELADLFSAGFVDICSWTHDRQHVAGLAHGLDVDDYEKTFLGFWFNRNVWSQKRPVTSSGEVLSTRQIIPREDLCRSEMFHEYLHGRGLHEGLRLSLWVDEESLADVSFLRPFSLGAFGPAEVALGQTVLPHLQRAAHITRRLRQAVSRLNMGESGPGTGDIAVIAFDVDGMPIWFNGAAETVIAQGDVLKLSGRVLSAATTKGSEQLRAAVAGATGRSGTLRQASAVLLPSPAGARLNVVVQPLSNRKEWPLPRPPAAVALFRQPEQAFLQPQRLQQILGLTKAEAQLALDLRAGLTLSEAAHRTGRTRNTTRTHLVNLMEKTGTTRQVDLVRLLADIEGLARPLTFATEDR